jgi:hypothetical protein
MRVQKTFSQDFKGSRKGILDSAFTLGMPKMIAAMTALEVHEKIRIVQENVCECTERIDHSSEV